MDRFVYVSFSNSLQIPDSYCLADQNVLRFYKVNIADRWEHLYRCRREYLKRNKALQSFVSKVMNDSRMEPDG